MAEFPPACMTNAGDLILITDQLFSPADFLLHRFLASHLKGTSADRTAKTIVLTVSENTSKWRTIASKSNVTLTQLIESNALTFLDVVSRIPHLPYLGSDITGSLRPLLDELRGILAAAESRSPFLVILDDISSLEWMGVPTRDLQLFSRALTALCRKLNAVLIIRHHISTPGDPDDLLRLLLQLCTYHIDVFPLSTGRSGTVSGQIALHPGAGTMIDTFKPIPRISALQYKLTDSGCVFFERGTSSGVL